MQSGIAALETAGRFLSAKGGTRAKRTERDKSGLPCEGFLASYDLPIRDSRRFRVLQMLHALRLGSNRNVERHLFELIRT